MLWGVLPLGQCAGVGLAGKLVAKAGLILMLSHGEAPRSFDDGQYRTLLQGLTIQFSSRGSTVGLLY
jgi:hypothetical protein